MGCPFPICVTNTRFSPLSSTNGKSNSSRTARPRLNAKAGRPALREERRIQQLEAKLATKNEVIAELMEENVHLKKVDGVL